MFVQALQAIDDRRSAALRLGVQTQLQATQSSLSAAVDTLNDAQSMVKIRDMERLLSTKSGEIQSLKQALAFKNITIDTCRKEYQQNLEACERQSKELLEKTSTADRIELGRVRAELQDERAEKALIEEQLAEEKRAAQGLLVTFGEAQNEAQWKRKLSHLRAEHKDLQLERDHYKRLCQSLKHQ